MKKALSMVLTFCLLGAAFFFTILPNRTLAADQVHWGEVQKGTYDKLHPFTLNWSGDVLDQGGLVLSTMKTTTKSSEADLIINQYGDIGAAAILQMDDEEELETPVDRDIRGFTNSLEMEQGAVYLVILHDGTFAKLRIDRILPDNGFSITKVMLSYVLESEEQEPSGGTSPGSASGSSSGVLKEINLGSPTQDLKNPAAEYEFEEDGAITIPWNKLDGDASWDMYRSDNGAPYVKMTDFKLTEPEYVDNYTFAGHTYLYKLVAYNVKGEAIYVSSAIKVTIIKKAAKPTPTPPADSGNRIELQLDSKRAVVNGKAHTLEVAPFLYDGRTLVPLRFISEALGAKVEWNGEERSITLTLGKDIIRLVVDSSEATVNGKTIYMDVPAKIFEGNTMVPVRFVSENLRQEVTFDDETFEIVITGPAVTSGGANSGSDSDEDSSWLDEDFDLDETYEEPTALEEFYGDWEMWVPAGRDTAYGGILSIYADGTFTYEWNGLQTGEWEYDDNIGVLVLPDYKSGGDWVATVGGDEIRVSGYYVYEEGERVD